MNNIPYNNLNIIKFKKYKALAGGSHCIDNEGNSFEIINKANLKIGKKFKSKFTEGETYNGKQLNHHFVRLYIVKK